VRLAIDGPGRQRAVNNCSIGGEEEGEVCAHAEDLLAGGGELADRCYTIVREVAAAVR
jgi:hypothetical protein